MKFPIRGYTEYSFENYNLIKDNLNAHIQTTFSALPAKTYISWAVYDGAIIIYTCNKSERDYYDLNEYRMKKIHEVW